MPFFISRIEVYLFKLSTDRLKPDRISFRHHTDVPGSSPWQWPYYSNKITVIKKTWANVVDLIIFEPMARTVLSTRRSIVDLIISAISYYLLRPLNSALHFRRSKDFNVHIHCRDAL